ncbi:MAG: hypothetical protein JWR00_2813 [Rubritepida sp.]|nr:hypothetical protein [Rubritepida sp.]
MPYMTVKHSAQAAKAIYKNNDFENFTLLGGFFDPKNDLTLGWHKDGDTGGASAGIYKYNNGKDQYILAFRGSAGSPLKGHKDWLTDDLQIGARITVDRASDCIKYAKQMQFQYRGAFILVVGHSLGGYLAQVVGVECGLSFITYNAPPAGFTFHSRHGAWNYSNGVNMRVNWDPVSRAPGRHVGPLITMPHYGGKIWDAHTNDAIERSMSRAAYKDNVAKAFITRNNS